ncbi:HDOD domain-containing protein [Megalodesulfovibrio paquesii]
MLDPAAPITPMLERIERLPLLSGTANALLQVLQREEYSLAEVARLVEADAALTINILKVVNAPSFGMGQMVTSIPRAVSFLGDKLVMGIALASSTPQVFNHDLAGYQGRTGQLWEHSLATAIAAREFARLLVPPVVPGLAYTAGILHDIGKAVLSEFLEGRAEELLTKLDSQYTEDFALAEAMSLGTDHATLGGLLARRWRLPEPLVQAIAYHHSPGKAAPEWRGLCCAVQLGDALAMCLGADTGCDALQYSLDDAICPMQELHPGIMDSIVSTVHGEFEKTRTLFFS